MAGPIQQNKQPSSRYLLKDPRETGSNLLRQLQTLDQGWSLRSFGKMTGSDKDQVKYPF